MAKISTTLLEELKKHEGVRSQVYDDLTGKAVSSYTEVTGAPTIAIGKKIQDHEREGFKAYLKGKAELVGEALNRVIRDTIEPREKKLAGLIKVPVTQSMFDAVFSLAFNTGFGAKSFKGVLEKLNAGDYKGAQAAIAAGPQTSKGKVLPGLAKRRAFEAAMFAKEGMTPTASVLAGTYGYDPLYEAYGATYEFPLMKDGQEIGKGKVTTGFLIGGGLTATALNGVLGGVVGGVAGAVLPVLSIKQGAKYGALAGAAFGAYRSVVAANKILADAKRID